MSDEPFLAQLGANTRGAPDSINLDVSGTVGPDYLGQETTNVDGHPCDRPGVQSRLPENYSPSVDPETGKEYGDPRISRMDTGEELPVLLSSSMSTDPIEGVQGSYTQIVEGECPRCGYDRLTVTVATLPGEHQEQCNACGAKIGHQYDDGYRMPTTKEDRAKRELESGTKIGDLLTKSIVDLEEDTGAGPYISLVGSRSVTRLKKSDVSELFWTLVENDDLDVDDEIVDHYGDHTFGKAQRLLLATTIVPDEYTVTTEDNA